MRKLCCFGILTMVLLAVSGCGGSGGGHDHHDAAPVFEAWILSAQPSDGDIAFDPVRQVLTITQGPDTVFFGIDDLDPHYSEYRAFLDFPLDGSTGEDVIPADARIVSAALEVFIDSVSFASAIPTRIDLVRYPIAGLGEADFDSPPFLSLATTFFASDYGRSVIIDITALMMEAQRLGLADFQIRLLLDPEADFGLVGIEDRPDVSIRAPQISVVYSL